MKRKSYTTEEKVGGYEAVISVFAEIFKELKDLGKKKPDATLSSSKVKMLNRILEDTRKLLQGEPECKYLDMLDDEELPQYSDAILMLAQYEGALKSFKNRYFGYDDESLSHGWFIQE